MQSRYCNLLYNLLASRSRRSCVFHSYSLGFPFDQKYLCGFLMICMLEYCLRDKKESKRKQFACLLPASSSNKTLCSCECNMPSFIWPTGDANEIGSILSWRIHIFWHLVNVINNLFALHPFIEMVPSSVDCLHTLYVTDPPPSIPQC